MYPLLLILLYTASTICLCNKSTLSVAACGAGFAVYSAIVLQRCEVMVPHLPSVTLAVVAAAGFSLSLCALYMDHQQEGRGTAGA